MTKSIEIVSDVKCYKNKKMALWDLQNRDLFTSTKNRHITHDWLMRKTEEDDFNFGYFITLTFYKQTKNPVVSYLDNKHLKKVILDFFYPHGKPKNRIRLWFFVEQHESGKIHHHFLMEKVDGLNWLNGRNRKITLNKKTLFNIISNNYCLDEVIIEALTIHLKKWVRKLGQGKKASKCVYLTEGKHKGVSEMEYKVHYCQKSLEKKGLPTIEEYDFNTWEHIDFEASDFDTKKTNNIKEQIDETD